MHFKLQRRFAVRARHFQLCSVRHNFADTHLRSLAGLRSRTIGADASQRRMYAQSIQHYARDVAGSHDQVRIPRFNLQLLNRHRWRSFSRIRRSRKRHVLSHATRIREVNHAELPERHLRPHGIFQPLRHSFLRERRLDRHRNHHDANDRHKRCRNPYSPVKTPPALRPALISF